MRRTTAAVALTGWVLIGMPGAAVAATVDVRESRGEVNSAHLDFKAAAGEGNRLTVSVVGESADYYDVRLVDAAASIGAGSGCGGGGSPGAPVDCEVHKPRLAQAIQCLKYGCTYVPGTEWKVSMHFLLGDAGSHLEVASMPDAKEIPLAIAPGMGDDVVVTGAGDDTIEASTGADTVRAGAGEDTFKGGPAADGADDVDLDPGFDAFEYQERTSAVAISDDLAPNDGAPGEGDKLVGGEEFYSGSGDDLLVGSPVPTFGDGLDGGDGDDVIRGGPSDNILDGEGGDDRIYGGSNHDLLRGGDGADRIYGEAGGDEIGAWSGDDLVRGGGGNDQIELRDGDDDVWGGKGNDQIELGEGADAASGGIGSDLLLGAEGPDDLHGGKGVDGLIGGSNRDSLFGGPGNDEIVSGVAPYSFSRGAFLHSPGPIENERDEVSCGLGHDRVGVDRTDALSGCEAVVRLRQLELFGVIQADGDSPAYLVFEVRSAGVVSISSPGLKPQRQPMDPRDGGPVSRLSLYPVGRAKRTLDREDEVTLRAKIVLHPKAGGKTTRFRTITLVKPS